MTIQIDQSNNVQSQLLVSNDPVIEDNINLIQTIQHVSEAKNEEKASL